MDLTDAYALAYGFGGNATRRRRLQRGHAVLGDLKLITKSPPYPVPICLRSSGYFAEIFRVG